MGLRQRLKWAQARPGDSLSKKEKYRYNLTTPMNERVAAARPQGL